jgi:hypothetical protein
MALESYKGVWIVLQSYGVSLMDPTCHMGQQPKIGWHDTVGRKCLNIKMIAVDASYYDIGMSVDPLESRLIEPTNLNLDRAIGDIVLNSRLSNTISITLINTNVYKRSVVYCSLIKVDTNW